MEKKDGPRFQSGEIWGGRESRIRKRVWGGGGGSDIHIGIDAGRGGNQKKKGQGSEKKFLQVIGGTRGIGWIGGEKQ